MRRAMPECVKDLVESILPDSQRRERVLSFIASPSQTTSQVWVGPGNNGKTLLARLATGAFPDIKVVETDGQPIQNYPAGAVILTNHDPSPCEAEVIQFDQYLPEDGPHLDLHDPVEFTTIMNAIKATNKNDQNLIV